MWPFRDARFIYEDNDAAFSGGLFLSAGHRLVFHRRTAASSRCMARPVGRWLEKPSRLSKRHTPDSQYRWPVSVSISLPTRPNVQRSLLYPCANAPALSALIRRFSSFAFNSGGRPVRAAPRKPAVRQQQALVATASPMFGLPSDDVQLPQDVYHAAATCRPRCVVPPTPIDLIASTSITPPQNDRPTAR